MSENEKEGSMILEVNVSIFYISFIFLRVINNSGPIMAVF